MSWRRRIGRGWQPRRRAVHERTSMINSVRGEVLEIGLDHVVIDVGGLGYAVQATPSTLATLRRGEQGDEVVQALVGLEFTAKPAEQAVAAVLAEQEGADASTVLHAALSRLGRSR